MGVDPHGMNEMCLDAVPRGAVGKSLPDALIEGDLEAAQSLIGTGPRIALRQITMMPLDASRWSGSGARFWRFRLAWDRPTASMPEDIILKLGATEVEMKVGAIVASREPGLAPRVWVYEADARPPWMLMDWLGAAPLGPLWRGREFALLLDAMARLHWPGRPWDRAALPPDLPEVSSDWASECVDRAILRGENERLHVVLPVLRRIRGSIDRIVGILRDGTPWTLLHGDCHLGNAGCQRRGGNQPACLFDWSSARWGPCLWDLSYFIACTRASPPRPGLRRLAGRYRTRWRRWVGSTPGPVEFGDLLAAATLLMLGAGQHLVDWATTQPAGGTFLKSQITAAERSLSRINHG